MLTTDDKKYSVLFCSNSSALQRLRDQGYYAAEVYFTSVEHWIYELWI